VLYEFIVNRGQLRIKARSSGRVILLCGSHSKIRLKIIFSSGEMGKMELRNFGSFRNARKVESSGEAFFHGLRPQVRLTRMTPRLQTSFGAAAYLEYGREGACWHSESKVSTAWFSAIDATGTYLVTCRKLSHTRSRR
jgi:hypothetical protein